LTRGFRTDGEIAREPLVRSLTLSLKSLALKKLPASTLQVLRDWAWTLRGQSQGPTKPIDLSLLRLLRETSLSALRDAHFLEEKLLPQLGLNDEGLAQLPEELFPFCGRGLRIWQYPNQFGPYLALLGRLGLRSYLEIGVRHGGTFVCTVEYLSRFQLLRSAVAVDLNPCASFMKYAKRNPLCRFLQTDSHAPAFREFFERGESFDLALIDGDHSEAGCWEDFTLVREKASVLAFHDIANDAVPGVGAVWRKVQQTCGDDYEFFEFTAQYPSVAARTGQRFLGIGVAVPKRLAAQAAERPEFGVWRDDAVD
jgi:hypothetical protein